MGPHVSPALASVTVAQAGEASTVTPLVQQGPGARTVPGNVTAPIMEYAIMVSTITMSVWALPADNHSLSLSLCLLRLSGA